MRLERPDLSPIHKPHPQTTTLEVREQIVALSLAPPTWGSVRLNAHLKLAGIGVRVPSSRPPSSRPSRDGAPVRTPPQTRGTCGKGRDRADACADAGTDRMPSTIGFSGRFSNLFSRTTCVQHPAASVAKLRGRCRTSCGIPRHPEMSVDEHERAAEVFKTVRSSGAG